MISPVRHYLLVEPIEVQAEREEKTKSGIILTSKDEDRLDLAVTKGTIVALGDLVNQKSISYEVGQVVYYNYFSGNQIIEPGKDPLKKDDKTYHLISVGDILAIER